MAPEPNREHKTEMPPTFSQTKLSETKISLSTLTNQNSKYKTRTPKTEYNSTKSKVLVRKIKSMQNQYYFRSVTFKLLPA